MKRITLTDSLRWFDEDSAIVFRERPAWSHTIHEQLYYTQSGHWVLNQWAQRGTTETYCQVDLDDAIAWLIRHECWDDDGMDRLPVEIADRVRGGFAEAEV